MRTATTAVLAWLCLSGVALAADDFVSGHVKGRVTDRDGKPVEGAKVIVNRLTDARVDLKSLRLAQVKTDADGHYELTIRFEPGKTLVVREIFVDRPGYVRAAPDLQLAINAGETATQDFVLDAGKLFAGTLRLPLCDHEMLAKQQSEKLQRSFHVVGPALGERSINAQFYQTEPGGAFAIYLPAGEYTVEVGPMTGYLDATRSWEHLAAGRGDLLLEIPPFEWTPENLGPAFDQLWAAMDRHYSYFFLKPDVDWPALKEQFRPRVAAAKNADELATELQAMLAPLRDLHVWIITPRGKFGTFRSGYVFNGNTEVVLAQLAERTECGEFAVVGKTRPDGFGYFLMRRQGAANPADVQKAVEAIRRMSDAPGFVVDLRKANGGSEPLAGEIARQFCATETIYAKNKRRSGPSHDEFGPENVRKLPATEGAFTRPTVCLIGPGAVSSGEGFVEMMRSLPHVTTVGLPTRGASGNPTGFVLPKTGVTVYFSRWVDMLPDGRAIEGVGIPPEVQVEFPEAEYASGDPTLAKGLEILRQKIAEQPAGP